MRITTVLCAFLAATSAWAGPTTVDDAAIVVRAYDALMKVHVLPQDAGRLAEAAARALPPGAPKTPAFGSDAGGNARLLERHARALLAGRKNARAAVWEAVRAMIAATGDTHTMLFDPAEMRGAMAIITGQPAACRGVALGVLPDGHIVATQVDPAGPTGKAGLKPGDVLLTVEGRAAATMADLDVLYARPAGTAISVTVRRPGSRAPVELRVKVFPWSPPVVDSRMLADEVGYLRMYYFPTSKDPSRDGASLVRQRLEQLARAGARSIVFDLRGNWGGDGIADVVSIFTDGDPVLLTRDARGKEKPWRRKGARWKRALPVTVLVDSGTFSAAEITAFALQDRKAALVMGSPTGGGASIPDDIELADGHLLHLTTKLIVGPVCRCVPAGQRVTPDKAVKERTPEELAAGVDRVLEAAVAEAKRRSGR